jgi:AbrB family looped-hinge helix DNA binding protein
MVVTLSTKGQIVIPSALRRKLRLKEGAKFSIGERDGAIVLQPVGNDPIEEGDGMLAGEPSLLEILLADRREEMAREERRLR